MITINDFMKILQPTHNKLGVGGVVMGLFPGLPAPFGEGLVALHGPLPESLRGPALGGAQRGGVRGQVAVVLGQHSTLLKQRVGFNKEL